MKKGNKKHKIDVPVDVYSLEKHLYSLMFSGLYVSNVDIRNIMKEMGYEAALDSRENLFEKLFTSAADEGRKKEAYALLGELVEKRMKRYKTYEKLYPRASNATHVWLTKSQKTLDRIHSEMEQMDA